MSSTIIRWQPDEEAALGRVQGAMQAHEHGRSLTRRDVLVALVRAEDGGIEARLRRIAEQCGIVYDERMTFAEFALAVEARRRP